MERKSSLAERILDRFEQHRHVLAEKQQQLDSSMKELLAQRERLATVARHQIETVVLPRVKELAQHFDNAKVEVLHTDADFSCSCEFSHTPRFPATVRLVIALLPGHNESLTARYDLNILPVLMEYNRNVEEIFPLEGDEDTLTGWVEDRILDFVDTYLRLETHPLYQKDNLVTDPVCGMQISAIAAMSKIEWPGRTIYFCSEVCKEAFSRREK